MPVGNTAQRPTGTTGMVRYNSTTGYLEYFNSSQWVNASSLFTVIATQSFTGDGSTVAFTLSSTQTTASCIVSINGVVQLPTTAYAVSGTTLTFTEAPASGDTIEVRQLTTTTTATSITNPPGNATIAGSVLYSQFDITGSLVPSANVTYSLGNATNRWANLFLSGNTLTLGSVVMKDSGGTIAFYAADGTTPTTIASSSIDSAAIANGTSAVTVIASGGNIRANVGGSTIETISSGGANITGYLTATGNVSGNYILGNGALLTGVITSVANINSGTSNVTVSGSGANITVSVGGTPNVAVFTTTGANVAGYVTATGNVSGGNLTTAGVVTATGNVSGGNLTTAGQVTATGNISGGNLAGTNITGTVTTATQNSITTMTGLTTIGAAGVATTIAGNLTVGGNLSVTGNSVSIGSTSLSIQDPIINLHTPSDLTALSSNDGADIGIKFHYYTVALGDSHAFVGRANDTGYLEWYDQGNDSGNVFTGTSYGVFKSGAAIFANSTVSTSTTSGALQVTGGAGVGGNIYVGGLVSVTGNVSGANLTTAGVVTATGNVSGGNLTTAGQVSATGNGTFGNITVGTGSVTAGSIINGNANGVGNIGTSSTYFNTVFAKATSAQYADLAENYVADAEYAPGTVVVFGGDAEVTIADASNDTRVAGVVSTQPSYLMNSTQEGEFVVAVALTGRVPCQVTGTVRKGDLMVSAGNGTAMANNEARSGTIIGKALENFDGDTGTIEVVVGRF
jgi:hypothetical protein